MSRLISLNEEGTQSEKPISPRFFSIACVPYNEAAARDELDLIPFNSVEGEQPNSHCSSYSLFYASCTLCRRILKYPYRWRPNC